ncbi:hypothetical protein [Desulfocicer niacini]
MIEKITIPDGWMVFIFPVIKKCFRLTRALIGRKASTPGGLSKLGRIPLSSWATKV